jgi:thioredoxin-like negative regulator of GroEL
VTTAETDEENQLPALVFVHSRRDGASRKMESLVAWIKVTQKKRLRVVDLDAERSTALAERLRIRRIPSLLLVKDRRVVGRLEGRATGRQIEELIRAHL